MLWRRRYSLLLHAVTMGAFAFSGCSTSPVVAPPVVGSIPTRPAPSIGNAGRVPQAPSMTASIPSAGINPWPPRGKPRDWKYVVIHHTATTSGSVESIHESHLKNKDKNGNAWLGIGYHFVIGNGAGMPDGAIEPTFRWRDQLQGAHAGSNDKSYNEIGIGVCLVGNFEKTPPTPAQRRSVKLLVQTLKREYRIPSVNVVGHNEIRASATECPGKLFSMADVAGDWPPIVFALNELGVPVEQVAVTSGSTLR